MFGIDGLNPSVMSIIRVVQRGFCNELGKGTLFSVQTQQPRKKCCFQIPKWSNFIYFTAKIGHFCWHLCSLLSLVMNQMHPGSDLKKKKKRRFSKQSPLLLALSFIGFICARMSQLLIWSAFSQRRWKDHLWIFDQVQNAQQKSYNLCGASGVKLPCVMVGV